MNIDYTVGEVELSYQPKFNNIYKVVSSEDAYKYLLSTYKEGRSGNGGCVRTPVGRQSGG